MYVKDMLNRIKWGEKDKEKYKVYYYDRLLNKNIEFDFKDISEIGKGFIKVREREIPLHRIREIRKDGKLIWER